MELPGIETDALPCNMQFELRVRSVSFRFDPARYLRFCFRVLTASRPVKVRHSYSQHGYFGPSSRLASLDGGDGCGCVGLTNALKVYGSSGQ